MGQQDQRSENIFCRGDRSKSFKLVGHTVSALTTQFYSVPLTATNAM